jgi:hypothetical protein
LLSDPERRFDFARRGLALVKEELNYDRSAEQLYKVYKNLTA